METIVIYTYKEGIFPPKPEGMGIQNAKLI